MWTFCSEFIIDIKQIKTGGLFVIFALNLEIH
jgi:hypothetical protein